MKPKNKLKYWLFPILTISSAAVIVPIGKNNSKLTKNENINSKFYEIINSSTISNSDKGTATQNGIGVKRFDIIFKGTSHVDLEDKVNVIAENYLKTTKKNLVYVTGQYLKTISIAVTENNDYETLKQSLGKFALNDEDVSSLYGFNTDYTFSDFIQNKIKQSSIVSTATKIPPRLNPEIAFDTRPVYSNYHLYELVGLNKDVIYAHFNEYVNKNPIKVGILEAKGVINNDETPFYWNKKYGNGAHWRNEWFYTESYSNHANNVGEILVGQKGINPTATLWSVELNTHWNGMAGEMNFFLSRGVKIINNSWGFTDPKNDIPNQVYNSNSRYFDELIKSNPEIVNFISAGNNYSGINTDELKTDPYKTLAGTGLSKNSIVVGAINDDYWQTKTSYSQVGSENNYLTAVAYGGEYNFSSKTTKEVDFSGHGTSFSTPVITALTSMVIQRNPYWFNLGHDSIIAKSAIISGSVKPRYTNAIYTNETGFGIPQFEFVDQAVKNLKYHKKTGPKFTTNHSIYLNKGDTIRANISWLAEISNKQNIVDFDLKVYDPGNSLLTWSTLGERNTETVEFTAQKSGYYNFNLLRYDSNDIKRDLAFTYAIKRAKN